MAEGIAAGVGRRAQLVWHAAGARRRRAAVGAVLAASALGLAAVASYAAKDDTTLASRASGADGAIANSSASDPAISADGRYVAFSSGATNLDPDDTDQDTDMYVRDTQGDTTQLVSRASGGNGAKANSSMFRIAISANGRYVAFGGTATNLDPDDTDTRHDVFVRDTQRDTTELVTRASGAAGAKLNGNAFLGQGISADGRYVAFHTFATNVHPADQDSTGDVYVRDRDADTTQLISRATGANGVKGDQFSYSPVVSANGRYVVYHSHATNLDPGDQDTTQDVFVRDLATDTTTLVSRASGADGAKGNGGSSEPRISADGRYVVFQSTASNLDPADGDTASDIYVRDLQTHSTVLASRAGGPDGAKANRASLGAISGDGRYVSFRSAAANLDPADTDTIDDTFVRDLQTDTTTLVSRASGAGGAKGNAFSDLSALSGDGRFVAFRSRASNFVSDDNDANTDIFVRDVLGPPPAAPAPAEPVPGLPPGTPTLCPAGTSASVRCVVDAKGRLAMMGTDADERFVGTSGRDRISPLGGDDVVFGNGGDDLISGGSGDDELHGGPGNDRLNGNGGNDKISGNDGDDSISGREGNDRLSGQQGDDVLWGGAGRDSISGGPGNDRLRGHAADDRLYGDAGRDLLSGGSGDDRLDGGPGRDRLRCGPGRDRPRAAAADDLGSSCRAR